MENIKNILDTLIKADEKKDAIISQARNDFKQTQRSIHDAIIELFETEKGLHKGVKFQCYGLNKFYEIDKSIIETYVFEDINMGDSQYPQVLIRRILKNGSVSNHITHMHCFIDEIYDSIKVIND